MSWSVPSAVHWRRTGAPSSAAEEGARALKGATSGVVLVLYLLLAVLLFAGAWRHPMTVSIGDQGDPEQFMWFYAWTPWALAHGHNPFFTTYVDYPGGVNLLWNASQPLLGFLLWPLTVLFSPVVTYNVIMTAALGLSAFTAYLLIRRYVRSPWAAAGGGLLYGFSPGMLAHSLGHPHVTAAAVLPPLLLLLLDDIVIRQRRPAWLVGAMLGVVAAAQLLIGEEFLLTGALVGLLAIGVLAALHWERMGAYFPFAVRALGIAFGVFLALAAIPLYNQFFGPQALHALVHTPDYFNSDLFSFIVPSGMQLLAPSSAIHLTERFIGGPSEKITYLGVPFVILVLLTAWRFWNLLAVRVATVVGVLLAVLSLGGHLHYGGHVSNKPLGLGVAFLIFVLAFAFRLLPPRVLLAAAALYLVAWFALLHVRFFENLLLVRLTIYVYLAAGVLVAVLIDALLHQPDQRFKVWATAGLAITLLTLLPRLPLLTSPPNVPDFFAGGKAETIIPAGSVAVVYPFSDSHNSRPMLWQAEARMRFKMPEGYVFYPSNKPYAELDPPASAAMTLGQLVAEGRDGEVTSMLLAQVRADLVRWQVQTVIVGPMPYQAQMVGELSSVLGQQPDSEGGVYVWTQLSL